MPVVLTSEPMLRLLFLFVNRLLKNGFERTIQSASNVPRCSSFRKSATAFSQLKHPSIRLLFFGLIR